MSGSEELRPPPREAGALTSDYDYPLPPGRVARYPVEHRDESRLLVVGEGELRHRRFRDLLELVRSGDVLVVNDSRVIPARLLGRKASGAPAEVLLIRPWIGEDPNFGAGEDPGTGAGGPGVAHSEFWEALVRPGGKLKPGRSVQVAPGLEVQIVDSLAGGGRLVRVVSDRPVPEALAEHGHMPLPPYIDREDEPLDRERYQTVYARAPGSIAAPTAGLHFTPSLLTELSALGVEVVRVMLHVGIGTFRPIAAEDPAEHPMHREVFEVSSDAANRINRARETGGRVWAVGTTVVRTLETVVGEDGRVRPGRGETDLFIRPPYRFRAVDALITNFHLPRSTLMMLVAAFAGYETTMEAYRAAISEGYRFYSYGDAMVVL